MEIELAKSIIQKTYRVNGDQKIRTENPIRIVDLAAMMEDYHQQRVKNNASLDSVSVSSSIKNIPDKIYLQIGESDVTEDQSITDWNELFHGAITWADERINKSDIEYSR